MKKNKVTINDIAREAKVSKSTISFYLNGHFDKMSVETRERIRQIIADNHYYPSIAARTLNSKQTHLIGVITGGITTAFSNQTIKGLNEYVQKHNYQLILGTSDFKPENESKCLHAMYNMGVDGFVVQPTSHFPDIWQKLNAEKPIVYFDTPAQNTPDMYVKTNNYEAVCQAMELCISRGYRHFLIVMADPAVIVTRQERVCGFQDCLDKHHLPYRPVIINHNTAVHDLLSELEPEIMKYDDLCIFAASNWILQKVHLALQPFRHLIPQRIGLIGMDSYEWSRLVSPSITTIVQPAEEEGALAGKILIDYIEGIFQEERSHILKCSINEMESTRRV